MKEFLESLIEKMEGVTSSPENYDTQEMYELFCELKKDVEEML